MFSLLTGMRWSSLRVDLDLINIAGVIANIVQTTPIIIDSCRVPVSGSIKIAGS